MTIFAKRRENGGWRGGHWHGGSNTTRRDHYAGGFPDGFDNFGEIIFIALAAVIANSEAFEDFERLAKHWGKWLGLRSIICVEAYREGISTGKEAFKNVITSQAVSRTPKN